jgi:hypothetical protein
MISRLVLTLCGSLAVFTMTIIVKIGRIIAPPIAHRARPDFVQIIGFPDRPQQPSEPLAARAQQRDRVRKVPRK